MNKHCDYCGAEHDNIYDGLCDKHLGIMDSKKLNQSSWQPIKTAPKDGTEIMAIFCNDYGYQEKPTIYGPWTAAYRRGKWMGSWDGANVIESQSDFGTDYKQTDLDPTHWQPMPKPPNATDL